MSVRRIAAGVLACAVIVTSCSQDDVSLTADTALAVSTGSPFPAERCAQNRAAGTIVYRSEFGFEASAGIVDVLVARQKGYFSDLCLDVDVEAGDASQNYPIVGANKAQFASAGSFNEIVRYRHEHPDAGIVALAVEGKQPNDALVVREGAAATLQDLRGTVIGVKDQLPVTVQAMLANAGLLLGADYTTKPLDGDDPLVHLADPDIVGFAVLKSNEPGQLDRAGIAYTEFDPADDDIPGSFGVIYANASFVAAHSAATQDFIRATMRGLADAVADPGAASMIALDFIANSGNANGLSADTEAFRWQTESQIVVDSTPADEPLGLPDADELLAEVMEYAEIGLFGGDTPDIDDAFDASVLDGVYDASRTVIWPGAQPVDTVQK